MQRSGGEGKAMTRCLKEDGLLPALLTRGLELEAQPYLRFPGSDVLSPRPRRRE